MNEDDKKKIAKEAQEEESAQDTVEQEIQDVPQDQSDDTASLQEKMEDTKPSKIRELNRKLYQKNLHFAEKERSAMHARAHSVPDDWAHPEEDGTKKHHMSPQKRSTIFKKFFIGSAVVFGIALVFAAFTIWRGNNSVSEDDIVLEVFGQAFADGGEELMLTVQVFNGNAAALELADIIIEYPTTTVGEAVQTDRARVTLGTIASGETRLEEVPLTLFGEEGELRDIVTTLQYRVANSNAIFSKDHLSQVTIRSTPIILSIAAPTENVRNQAYTADFTITSNAVEAVDDMLFTVEYPRGFEFVEANPAPSFENNVWVLGTVESGSEQTISITGIMPGLPGDENLLRAFVGRTHERKPKQIGVTFNSLAHLVRIQESFLRMGLRLQGSDNNVVSVQSDEPVQGTVSWTNVLPTELRNVEIGIAFSGSAYRQENVQIQGGFFNSLIDQITLDQTNSPELAVIGPGETGTTGFSITPRPSVTTSGGLIESPAIQVTLHLKGTEADGTVREIENVVTKTALVHSDIRLTTQTLHANGAFENSGSTPPRVEEETSYTLHWEIANSANTLTNATVKTTLADNVRWLESISPDDAQISYNTVTKEVTWRPGTVERGAGITGPGKEVSFQVAITPSRSQAGRPADLTSDVFLTAEDTFTGATLRSSLK